MMPVLMSLLVLVLLNASSIYTSFSVLDEFEALETQYRQPERQVNAVLSDFKTQVQEWKNVLLRGHKTADRDKYWKRFQARELAITDAFKILNSRYDFSPDIKQDITDFTKVHAHMATKYREGYEAFVNSNFDHKVADDFVRGIDREPAKLLAQIADKLAQNTRNAQEDLTATTQSEMWVILVATIVLSIICVVYVVARLQSQVISPIKRIAACIKGLSHNDYDYALTYRSLHELGTLAEAARELQTKLKSTVTILRQAEVEMNTATSTLSEVSNEIQSGATDQQRTSHSLDKSTDQLKGIVQNLVAITDQVAVATSQSEENIASCHVTFEKANQGFSELARTVSSSSDIVDALQSRSANILKVVNVINEIADQTNLLALNAAIEAARAGEHGRGFAVVADEVRALAAKTQQSTREINDILGAFEQEANSAVTAMQSGKSLADTNAIEAGHALSRLNEVVTLIQETAGVVGVLNDAADEQEAVLSSVEKIIQDVIASSNRYQALSERDDISNSMQRMATNLGQVVDALTHTR